MEAVAEMPNVITHSAIIGAFSKGNKAEEAWGLSAEMQQKERVPKGT
jgi:pentatricopeptide repeat protein